MQIISGFSDIKTQLIKKCKLNKSPQELELWFTENNDMVFAHDKDEHKSNILIAMYDNGVWKNYLDKNSLGARTVNYCIQESIINSSLLLAELIDNYKSSGFLARR